MFCGDERLEESSRLSRAEFQTNPQVNLVLGRVPVFSTFPQFSDEIDACKGHLVPLADSACVSLWGG